MVEDAHANFGKSVADRAEWLVRLATTSPLLRTARFDVLNNYILCDFTHDHRPQFSFFGMASPLKLSSSILIVGGGTWGVSTALHLARRGYVDVTVLDSYPVPSAISAGNDINKIVELGIAPSTLPAADDVTLFDVGVQAQYLRAKTMNPIKPTLVEVYWLQPHKAGYTIQCSSHIIMIQAISLLQTLKRPLLR